MKPSIVNDRMSRVQRLSVLFQTGRIFLNPDNKFDDWSKEMVVYPRGSHDDCIDSLCYAIQASQVEEDSKTDWNAVAGMISTKKAKPANVNKYHISRI